LDKTNHHIVHGDEGLYHLGASVKENIMATGPRGERRPDDVMGAAIMVGRLSVGIETEDLKEPSGRVRSGKAGGKARAEKLTREERSAVARKAAARRWG